MLWSAYASYVLAHCPKTDTGYRLDDMAGELFDQASHYETHGTF